ncbi:MAG: 1-acyl-sn-glycerol-3-phosphate acyltransferase [Alphaproteobacteria bacterium]|nr:1-acyl-sn-glycerol-3-phosphate acyltransferase [Alphaproteobacteria bacterium]
MSLAEPAEPLHLPKRPFHGLTPLSWAIYRSTWLFLRVVDRVAFRTRARGNEAVDNGPLLLLSNHVSILDPFVVGLQLWRPCRFMAATSVCNLPVIGPYLQALGAFPKMKYIKDRESMRILSDHYENNLVVTLFPEGVQTWNGEPMPVHEGIGRLIQRMNARVIFARNRTGFLVLPRWARFPRYVPLEIDYIGPVTYAPGLSAEAIAQDVAEQLALRPERDRSRLAFGFRMAEGMPQLLWACPSCFAPDALEALGWRCRDLRCRACGATWRPDVDMLLHGLDGAPTLPLAEAHRAIEAHFGERPVLVAERGEAGLVAEHPGARLRHFPSGGKPALRAEGPLALYEDHLQLGPEGQGFRLPLSDLLSVSVDIGSQLFLRVASEQPKGEVYRLETPGHSSLKWGGLLRAWAGHPPIQAPRSKT